MAVNLNWKRCLREAALVFLDVLQSFTGEDWQNNDKSQGRINTT
jgi:hypothetical protein